MSDKILLNKFSLSAFGSFVILALIYLVYVTPKNLAAAEFISAIFVLYIAVLLLVNKKFKFGYEILNKITSLQMVAFSAIMLFSFFDTLYTFAAIVFLVIALFYIKVFTIRDCVKMIFVFAIIALMAVTMFQPAVVIAKDQGTVLSGNWWNSLQWMKNNTKECAVIATYWDPGHFITGIARRPVVFDGASQNSVWTKNLAANASEEEIKAAAVTDKYTVSNIVVNGTEYKQVQTARIQDIATILYTDNETYAKAILEKYRIPGCDEMYFLASADLIGKSYWWTYFSTWDPIDKGCAIPMSQMSLAQAKQNNNGGMTFVYQGGLPAGCNQQVGGQVVVIATNSSIDAYALTSNRLEPISDFFYFTQTSGVVKHTPNATFPGMAFLDPSFQSLIFIPQEIQNSMFTRMFFFNGQDLTQFQNVNSWGGEVKLYKLDITS